MASFSLVTSIPLNNWEGSGCFVGVETLAAGLRMLGHHVSLVAPRPRFSSGVLTRAYFNQALRYRRFAPDDVVIGVDADGYTIAGRRSSLHVAAIKGVIADVLPYEMALSRMSIRYHARREKLHAKRADLVVTPSQYCADRIRALYDVERVTVVPEPIDLDAWRRLREDNPAVADREGRFVVLCTCRFYPRKDVRTLLNAAAQIRACIPGLEVRIVGDGPERERLQRLSAELALTGTVRWLSNVSPGRLAREYNGADVFCLPSLQEGFGIVFLEAMAAGLPIVATRAAAIPEVVQHGVLVEPGNAEELATALYDLSRNPPRRRELGDAGRRDVERFGIKRVTEQFVRAVDGASSAMAAL